MSEQLDNNTAAETHIPTHCERCGRLSMAAPLEVSEDNMKEYLRCALGNRPFSKVIPVMGVIELTFTMIPADVEIRLEKLLNKEELPVNGIDIRMLMALEKITKYDEDTSETITIYEKTLADRKKILDDPERGLNELTAKLDVTMLNLTRRASIGFTMLCNMILESMVNKDFYEGVGLL